MPFCFLLPVVPSYLDSTVGCEEKKATCAYHFRASGLRSKVVSEEEVELRWSTGDEDGNEGFIVQRRKGGTERFEDIADYTNFAPLRTKGAAGGSYTYLDDTVPSPGTWVYRIVDCDVSGSRSAICQKLVEVDSQVFSPTPQISAHIIGHGIGVY